MKFKAKLLALIWVGVFSGAAWADEVVTIRANQSPVAHALDGRHIDVNGFTTGMTEVEVKKLLAKKYSRARLNEERISLTMGYKGARLESQEFTNSIGVASKHDETKGLSEDLTLFFSGPALGNVVRGIYRRLYFDDVFSAPKMDDVVAGLVAKYGEPSTDSGYTTRWGRELDWHFLASGMYVCRGVQAVSGLPRCPASASPQMNVNTQVYFKEARQEGIVYAVKAYLRPHPGSVKLMDLEVKVDDIENRALGMLQGDAQMRNFVDGKLNGAGGGSSGGKTPAL